MRLSHYFKKLIDTYVTNKVNRIELPFFEQSSVVRKSLVFSGRIQKVKFRLEVYELAKKLNLTGWVKNRADKKVECEIQGEDEKIIFLINHLKSLKRASVKDVKINKIETINNEIDFIIKKE